MRGWVLHKRFGSIPAIGKLRYSFQRHRFAALLRSGGQSSGLQQRHYNLDRWEFCATSAVVLANLRFCWASDHSWQFLE
jgi:hypothetical protein